MKRATQTDRIRRVLADGEWHGVEDLYSAAGPSARTRLSEMLRAEPERYESRFRSRYDRGGEFLYSAKDWRQRTEVLA